VVSTRWAIDPGAEGKDGASATFRAAGTVVGNLPISSPRAPARGSSRSSGRSLAKRKAMPASLECPAR
jgi:hypothetical protein